MLFKSPAPGSLARRFAVAAAALAAVALSVTALASLWIVSQQHTAALRALVQKEVDFNAALVSGNLREISSLLSDVAGNSILATALVDSAGRQTYLTPYLNSIQKINGIPIQILFTDFEGKEIANNGNASFNQEQLAWLRSQIDHGRETAVIFAGKKGPELVVVELLSYSRTRTPEGALLYKIALSDLQRNLAGTLVWHERDASRESAAESSMLNVQIDMPPNLASLGFHMRAEAPTAPGDHLIPQYLIIFLITGALAAGVLIIGSRMALSMTKDLRRLEAFSTGMVTHGFGKQRAEVSGSNEVAGLARSINHMLDSLHDQHTQLQHESEKLRQLANTIPQLAWMAHPDGDIHWYNDRWYAYTGSTPEQMRGWGWQSVHDPKTLPVVTERWKASLTAGEPFEMRFPLRGADGEFRPFFTRVAPLRDAAGNIVQWFGTNTDVSSLERAEKAVRESEERLREGLVAARMAVWDWDLKSQHFKFSANAQDVLGHSRDNVNTVMDAVHPDDRQALRERVEQAIAERSQYESLVRAVRPDNNQTIWLELKGKVNCDASGKPRDIRGIALDVTDRKRAEDDLRMADRRKDEFLAMLAHELRNPLAPISTAAELLNLLHADHPRIRQTSEIIARQVDHMTDLIDDLLDVSRVTRGIITLEKEPIEIGAITAGALEQTRSLIDARNHRLTVQPLPDPAYVYGDQTRLIQVMANLLNNAAKYTPSGGEIVVQIETDGHDVLLGVSDTGAGIPADLLPHVFELFSQAERTPDRSQGGLGLGLALVKSLVELHGGNVVAHSDGVGKGSRFVVRLPRLAAPAIVKMRDEATPSMPGPATALRLMVVDDNVDAARTLAMLLEAWGHQVSVEHEGRGALERARIEAPRIMLLDIGLPDMDGYALARRLRAMPQTAHAVLIALTGYGQKEDRARSEAAGFDYHLVKPTNPEQLAGLLAELSSTLSGENRIR